MVRLGAPTVLLAALGAAVAWPLAGDLLVLLGGLEHFRGAEDALDRRPSEDTSTGLRLPAPASSSRGGEERS